MKRFQLALFGILLLLSACISLSYAAGNCSQAAPQVLSREKTHYEIRGLSARTRAAMNFVALDEGELVWTVLGATERNKTKFNTDGSERGIAACSSPIGGPEGYDPLVPHIPNEDCPGSLNIPCGALLQHWPVEDFDCYTEKKEELIEGVRVESISTTAWLHSNPSSFRIFVTYQVADEDFEFQVPRRIDKIQTIRFEKDVVKLSYRIAAVPWKYEAPELAIEWEEWNDISFLNLYFSLLFASERPGVAIFNSTGGYSTRFSVKSLDERFEASGVLELETIIGNKSFVGNGPLLDVIQIDLPENNRLNWTVPNVLCPIGVGHWDLLEYDPSFVALFSPEPEIPTDSPQKKKGISRGAIAGISLGAIAFVALVVAGLAILSAKNATFKSIIRPFAARNHHAGPIGIEQTGSPASSSSPAAQSGWTSASKPPQ